MIQLEEVLRIHEILIEQFGGTPGIRDLPGIESAIARPFSTFGNQELYPSIEDKAAAIIESIVSNHPFLDGNKRTGYVMMRLTLLNYGKDITASEDEKYDFVIRIASGQLNFDAIKLWISQRSYNSPPV